MIELLVAALCVGNYKCDAASKAYLSYNPRPKLWAREQYQYLEEAIGKNWIIAGSVLYSASSNHNYQVRVNKRVSVGRVDEGFVVIYGGTF